MSQCKLASNLSVEDIRKCHNDKKNPINCSVANVSLLTGLSLIKRTVCNFVNSDHDFITTRHVPRTYFKKERDRETYSEIQLGIQQQERIAALAEIFWQKMIDPRDKEIDLIHDGYLKVHIHY